MKIKYINNNDIVKLLTGSLCFHGILYAYFVIQGLNKK